MARAAWNGTLSLGLVNIPFKVYVAKDDKSKGISFNQLHSTCKSRLNQKMHCATCQVDVQSTDIVKGYEHAKGQYLVIDPSELEGLKPESDKVLSVNTVVSSDLIAPIRINDTYYLTPDGPVAGEAYAIVREALRGKAAIGQLTVRDRDHIAAVVPQDNILVLHLLAYDHQIRSAQELDGIGHIPTDVKGPMLDLGRRLLASMEEEDLDLSVFTDSYKDKVLELLKAKAAGETVAPPTAAPAKSTSASLLEALQASVSVMASARPKRATATKAPITKAAAKKGKKKAA